MDWEPVGKRLHDCFAAVIAEVETAHPTINALNVWDDPDMGVVKFRADGSFCYEPATAESEDLNLSFRCAPADRGWFRDENGNRAFPGLTDRDAVGFEIERGTGLVLAALDPVLLPADETSPEYAQAVLDYAEKACAFVEAHRGLILEALRTPYQA